MEVYFRPVVWGFFLICMSAFRKQRSVLQVFTFQNCFQFLLQTKNSLFPQDLNKQNMFCICFMGSTTRNLTLFAIVFFCLKTCNTFIYLVSKPLSKILFFSACQTNRRWTFLFSVQCNSKNLILSEGRENSLFQVAVNIIQEKYACVYSYPYWFIRNIISLYNSSYPSHLI